ncbi:trypsin-like serine protease [Egicoccus sp. AB-alg6-2]|uniref:trypsin-like serine protease n=1 Tax=Egicoccus sp. AB-alg6-2 TaxID=3242692 RepID=UPI00359CCD5F
MFMLALAALFVVAGAMPAAAITQGTPDGKTHPMVGQLFFHVPDDPDPRFTTPGAWYSCTGTLIAPNVVLTAGHCTFAIGKGGTSTLPDGRGGTDVWITFEELPNLDELLAPSLSFNGDNAARYAAWSKALNGDRTWLRGTAQAHPNYDERSFYMADVGVVVLDKSLKKAKVAQLPEAGYLDRVLADKNDDKLFTPVGYGVQSMVPFYDPGGTRQWSTSKLIDLRGTHGIPAGTVAKFSNNLGKNHTGGACSGDSGGPLFKQGSFLIGAITSYGISPCIGNDGAYRIDKELDLGWIRSFVR